MQSMIIQFPMFAPPEIDLPISSPRILLSSPSLTIADPVAENRPPSAARKVPQWVRDIQQAQAENTAHGVQSRRKT
jgi:hypothetical protein